MSVNKKNAVLKTALLAPGGTLLSWGVQNLLAGDPLLGGMGMLIGLVFVGGFVALNERDFPYDDEVVGILSEQLDDVSEEQIADALKQGAEVTADAVEERTDNK